MIPGMPTSAARLLPSSVPPDDASSSHAHGGNGRQAVRLGHGSPVLFPPIPYTRTHTTFFGSGRAYNVNNPVARLGGPRNSPPPPPEEQPTQVNMLSPSKPRVTSQSAEFATRFAHRPSTRPKVIGLDSETMIPRPQGNKGVARGIGGFFPPVKLRMAPGEPQLPPGHSHRTAKVSYI